MGDVRGREVIATRIIDLARSGVIDATALRDGVIGIAFRALRGRPSWRPRHLSGSITSAVGGETDSLCSR
jgi:hypothetical protein